MHLAAESCLDVIVARADHVCPEASPAAHAAAVGQVAVIPTLLEPVAISARMQSENDGCKGDSFSQIAIEQDREKSTRQGPRSSQEQDKDQDPQVTGCDLVVVVIG